MLKYLNEIYLCDKLKVLKKFLKQLLKKFPNEFLVDFYKNFKKRNSCGISRKNPWSNYFEEFLKDFLKDLLYKQVGSFPKYSEKFLKKYMYEVFGASLKVFFNIYGEIFGFSARFLKSFVKLISESLIVFLKFLENQEEKQSQKKISEFLFEIKKIALKKFMERFVEKNRNKLLKIFYNDESENFQ